MVLPKDGCSNPIQKGAGFEVYQTVAGTENRIYGERYQQTARSCR